MAIRMSNMIRCPVSCIVQVWTYSAANATTRMTTYSSGEPVQAFELSGRDVPVDGHLHQVRLRQRGAGTDEDARRAPPPPDRQYGRR